MFDIEKRLESLGYTLNDSDKWMIEFMLEKVTNTIKNDCNVSAIPEGLHQIAVDMVCGEFLFAKKQSGQLGGFNVELSSAILKQTQSGDTNVVFAFDGIQTPEQRLDAVIKYLMNYGRGQFASYRRLKWT